MILTAALHRAAPPVVALVALLQLLPAPAALAAPAAPEAYVAMGDSYTAGPLVPNQLPDPPGCHRSDHNYPHLAGAARGFALRDVSCSGATTEDLTSAQAVDGGPNPPQLDAIDGGTAVVSLQVGGDDIGFGEILRRCFTLLPLGTPCRDTYTAGGVDEISRRVAATAPRIEAAVTEVHRRAPQARVFVVGYPAILPEVQPGCWPLLPFAPDDVPWLRAKEAELNAMLAAAAAQTGATYVDTYGPSVGHDACQLPGTRWIEPAVPLSLAYPVHPNSLGMAGMAAALLTALAG